MKSDPTTPHANSSKTTKSVYISPADVNEPDTTQPEDELRKKVASYIEAAYLHGLPIENLDTGTLEPPADIADTAWITDEIMSLIRSHDTARDQALLTELLAEMPEKPRSILPEGEESHSTYNDGKRDTIDQVSSLLTSRLGGEGIMNVASLILCKELYKLSLWQPVDELAHGAICDVRFWVERTYSKPVVMHQLDSAFNSWQIISPAYDLGFILRKLPKLDARGYIQLTKMSEEYQAVYAINSRNDMGIAYAETPEDAACALAIKLFQQNILGRSTDDAA